MDKVFGTHTRLRRDARWAWRASRLVDVSMDGIELEDRELIAAIKSKREPNSSLAQSLIVNRQRKAHA